MQYRLRVLVFTYLSCHRARKNFIPAREIYSAMKFLFFHYRERVSSYCRRLYLYLCICVRNRIDGWCTEGEKKNVRASGADSRADDRTRAPLGNSQAFVFKYFLERL